jgi:hypothetical protein
MSTPFLSRGFRDYPEQTEDEEWIKHLIVQNPIPSHLLSSIDLKKLERDGQSTIDNVNRFFETLKKDGQITLDSKDPSVEAFLRAKKWSNSGGPMPVTSWEVEDQEERLSY